MSPVELRVPCDVLSVAVVRRRFAAQLLEEGCSEVLVHDAAMVLSELLMNAIVHGAPDADDQVGAAWSLDDDHLTVRVSDSGGGVPQVGHPDEDDGGGRGLLLVERLSESWHSERRYEGTEVTAVLTTRRIRPAGRR